MPEPSGERPPAGRLRDHWIAEVIRLRETQWGPLDDGKEVRQLLARGGSFAERVLCRARRVGARDGLDETVDTWWRGARLTLLALAVLALFTGAGAAMGALGNGTHAVNLLLALVALLGLHTLTLLVWLLSGFLEPDNVSWLTNTWLWLTRKLAKGPQAALVPRALLELSNRTRTTRPLSGCISHGLWLIALLSALLTLMALLAARRYQFQWETTLLSADTFVWLTHALGWLPALAGFPLPDDTLIRASNGLQPLPDSANAVWSVWLAGCVVVYGIVPRLGLLLWNGWQARRGLGRLRVDETLPGFAELRERLLPVATHSTVDTPPPAVFTPQRRASSSVAAPPCPAALAGIELAPDLPWPPGPLPENVTDLGRVDSRTERHGLLQVLHDHPPERLLLVCDAGQTPDRGTVALLAELAGVAGHTQVLLLNHNTGRTPLWQQQLTQAGLPEQDLVTDIPAALRRLGTGNDTTGGARHE